MQNKVCCVVGDCYVCCSKYEGIITCSQLLNNLEERIIPAERIIIGQGVDKETLDRLRTMVCSPGIKTPAVFIDERFSLRVSHYLVHKTKPANVLITSPVEIGDSVFQSSLIIDGNCDDLSDHITGVHIQGTILIEAGRQMYTAVSELFLKKKYLKKSTDALCGSYRFVLNEVNVSFYSYLFPLNVDIILSMKDVTGNKRGTAYIASATIEFYQMKTLGSKIYCKGVGYPTEMMESFEELQAMRVCRKFFAG